MKTKAFVLLLVAILALGGGVGGAFAGGMAIGKSRGEKAARSNQPAQSPFGSGQQSQGQLTQEQLQQLRQQLQGQFGQGGNFQGTPVPGMMGRGGLSGTVEKVEGNTVTVNTPQGPLQATISADTTITVQTVQAGTLQDLTTGLRVTVIGQRDEDGTVIARSIVITPEGAGFLGGGFFGGQQSP